MATKRHEAPGVKTSEFWLSLLAVLVGAALAIINQLNGGGAAATIVGGLVALLGSIGYTVPKISLKKTNAQAEVLKGSESEKNPS